MTQHPIIVVGAGQAGLQIADSLRRGGYSDELLLIGEETSLPYQRPPLSKQYMSDDMADERLLFRPEDYYAKQNISVLRDTQVRDIDLQQRTVTVAGDGPRAYSKIALTTGARVRKLPIPGGDHPGVYYLRGLTDAREIRQQLGAGSRRLVAIGGGFIGLEMAASAREMGHEVTIVETQDRLMARVVAPLVSRYYQDLHESRGAQLKLNATVNAIEPSNDKTLSVLLADGEQIVADLIIVGIGSIPNDELAAANGIACDNGILVDEFAQTSDPDVVAAGDCTMHFNAKLNVRHRLESVQNAVDQAKVAAATLLGDPKPYVQVPWFWSDQYDAKLQMVGTSVGSDRTVLRGSVGDGAFSAFHFAQERLLGVDSVNRPADHLVSRKLIANDVVVPENWVKNSEQNLKLLLS